MPAGSGINPNPPQETEIQNFLANVPFEDVLAKVIKTDKLELLVAVNKDIISSIIDPFVKKGFILEAVVPCFLYGQNINITNGLTVDAVRTILRKPELLKAANLLTDHQEIRQPAEVSQTSSQNERGKEKKPQNIRQFILIGVFVVLIIVLVIVLFTSGILNS